MKFSLFYFAAEEPDAAGGKYDLLLDGARFADENGFEAVWTPERHFDAFGGLYPSPAITAAAIATITRRVGLRAGSVVLPLNDTIRVAEEWSVIDNLSGGRVGISFASGWHVNDFVLSPDRFVARKEVMFEEIDSFRRLWRGGSVLRPNGLGENVEVRVRPHPVQDSPPLWITAAGSLETARRAGEIGANLLTHLRGQTIDDVRRLVEVYRQARQQASHDGGGEVTLMVHTYVGRDEREVREIVRGPLTSYLSQSLDFAHTQIDALRLDLGLDDISVQDRQSLLEHAFERYFSTSGLFGTPLSCIPFVERAREAGVTELASLIDFGIDVKLVLGSLRHLNVLRMSQREGL